MTSLITKWGLFSKGKKCPRCKKAFQSWLGYNKHCAKCLSVGYSLGVAYTYIMLIVSVAVVTLLYAAFSLPIDSIYDLLVGQWMRSNPEIFGQERLDTVNWLMNVWLYLPVVIALSAVIFGIQRTLAEKRGY
jgi:hypothetical protein